MSELRLSIVGARRVRDADSDSIYCARLCGCVDRDFLDGLQALLI